MKKNRRQIFSALCALLALAILTFGFASPNSTTAATRPSKPPQFVPQDRPTPECDQPCYLYIDPETGEITVICPCP